MHHVVVRVGTNYSCHSPFEVLLLVLFVIPIMLPSWREQGGEDSNTPIHTHMPHMDSLSLFPPLCVCMCVVHAQNITGGSPYSFPFMPTHSSHSALCANT